MTTTPTLRDAAQAVTIITTPSGDHRWIAKDAAEVAHFSQPGQGHKIEVYSLAAPADALAEPVATLHSDGFWTPEKNASGRALNSRLAQAGTSELAYTATQLQQAVARERKECAQICIALSDQHLKDAERAHARQRYEQREDHARQAAIASACAAAIRAKGQQ